MAVSASQLGRLIGTVVIAAVFGSFAWAQAPIANGTGSIPSGTTATSRTVQGRVINALTGATIARALVSLNNRSVLTDSEGRFAFPDFTDASASAIVTKPGFAPSASGLAAGAVTRQRITDLDATIELKLYPDAVISGTLTDGDGLPLERVPVSLLRQYMQPDGLRWQPVRTVQTTSRGEFRFREPAGRFRLSVNSAVRTDVVLPVTYPGRSASDGLDYFELTTGQERQIDLRARTSPSYQVTVRVEPAETRGLQFSAVTGTGESLQVPLAGQTNSGVLVSLPSGSFTLRGTMQNRETMLTGSARVTVTGPRTDPVVLHLEPAATLPVELSIDSSSSNGSTTSTGIAQVLQAPNARQFNLRLQRLDESSPLMNQDIQLRMNDDKTESFQVPPGRYRLVANAGGAWFIESATYGVANLMTSEITIGSGGGGGTPIRLVVSNARGTLSGTVKLTASPSGAADTIWLYLIPKGPSLGAINPIGLGNNGSATATFTVTVAPGSYLAVAMDHRSEQDLRDPGVIAKLSTAKTVEVTAAATSNVDLEITQGAAN